MMHSTIVRLSHAFLALALLACGGGGDDDVIDAAPPNMATAAITTQAQSDCGANVTATVTVTNFVLEEPTGQPNQDGHGHYHIYLDDATGGDYLVVGAGGTADVKIPVLTAAGAHMLRVELADNDHTPIGVSATAQLDVTANPCVGATATPTTIAAGGVMNIDVEINNFILEEPVGQPNQAGHGHYHIYLDGAVGTNYLESGAADPVDILIPGATSPGAHTLRVSIGGNDHAPLVPAVETILDITVQ